MDDIIEMIEVDFGNVKSKWRNIRALNAPKARFDHGLIYHKKKLYVFGGFTMGHDNLSDCFCLDLSKNIPFWDDMDIENIRKMSKFSCNIYKNSILIFGGVIDDEISNELYCINIDEQEMFKQNVIGNNIYIAPRIEHESCILKHRLFIFGGCGKSWHNLDDNNIYYIDLMDNYKLHVISTSLVCRSYFSMLPYNAKLSSIFILRYIGLSIWNQYIKI